MYFHLPGILSQYINVFLVDGNIGRAIDLAYLCPLEAEVSSAIDLKSELVCIERGEQEVSSALPTRELIYIELGVQQVNSTEPALYLTKIDSASRELFWLRNTVDLHGLELANSSLLKGIDTGREISTIQSATEVFEISGSALEISQIEFEGRELSNVRHAVDLSGVVGSDFLPGSPGYVAGIANAAVEIIGFGVGTIPLRLPVGFLGFAKEIVTLEIVNRQVATALTAQQELDLASAQRLISTVRQNVNYLSTIEAVESEQALIKTAHKIESIEAASKFVSSAYQARGQLFRVEAATKLVSSSIKAMAEVLVVETGGVWRNEPPLAVQEISPIYASDRKTQKIDTAVEIISDQTAVSAITKP